LDLFGFPNTTFTLKNNSYYDVFYSSKNPCLEPSIDHLTLGVGQFSNTYAYGKNSIKLEKLGTVNLLFSTPDRDRPVSVTKLWSQISHPNRILFTVL
jgi:hypothetical protein